MASGMASCSKLRNAGPALIVVHFSLSGPRVGQGLVCPPFTLLWWFIDMPPHATGKPLVSPLLVNSAARLCTVLNISIEGSFSDVLYHIPNTLLLTKVSIP